MEEGTLRLAGVEEDSIVDGPGIRLAVFTQGCPHHCEGCHNAETWAMDQGEVFAISSLLARMQQNPLCRGLTLSGGEPLVQITGCMLLAEGARTLGKNMWLYSGYMWEEISVMRKTDPDLQRLMQAVDVLVDGRFVLAERDLTLQFRGSRNQRLIDVQKSLVQDAVVLWKSVYEQLA